MTKVHEDLFPWDLHQTLSERLRPANVVDAEMVEELAKPPDGLLGPEKPMPNHLLGEALPFQGRHEGLLVNVGLCLHRLQFEIDALGLVLPDLPDFAETVGDAKVGADR